MSEAHLAGTIAGLGIIALVIFPMLLTISSSPKKKKPRRSVDHK